MRLLGMLSFGMLINFLIWPVTKTIWSESVHKMLLEQARDADLANRIALYTLDLGMAIFLMVGIGLFLAVACVQTMASALSR